MPTIYSTLSNDRTFPKYEPSAKDGRIVRNRYGSAILIKGGANVANKHHQTQKFVETEVSDAELKALKENPVFKRLADRGFLTMTKPSSPKRDGAAPKTEEELKAKAGKKGVDVKLNTADAEE